MLRVLLVEDEILISFSTSLTLEDAGFHVMVAYDGQEGLELALQERPDVIVTDFMMPKLNGLEMIASLREQRFEGPIVLATSIPEANLPSRPGYNAYLAKPYSEAALKKMIESVT
jgi:CheY-like chemotaxis protein